VCYANAALSMRDSGNADEALKLIDQAIKFNSSPTHVRTYEDIKFQLLKTK
jgi:hypothetical protein